MTAAVLPTATASAASEEQAEATLRHAQDALASGEGDPSTAIHEVALTRSALRDDEDREAAQSLFPRPPDGGSPEGRVLVYTTPEATPYDTPGGFRLHYVTSTADAPALTDTNGNGVPDFVEQMGQTFDEISAKINGPEPTGLGWNGPVPDGTLGGGTDLIDVYIGKIDASGVVSVDDEQPGPRYTAFMMMRNEYSTDGFLPEDLDVTAAHEYLHVLHFGYNGLLDAWIQEATASWVEDQVFPSITNYYQYVNHEETGFGRLAMQALPLTDDAGSLKRYGANVFFQYLSDRLGPKIVRQVWDQASNRIETVPSETDPDGAPSRDYGITSIDAALKAADPAFGFAEAFIAFSAAQAEWKVIGNGFHDGPNWLDVDRQPAKMAVGGTATAVTLDHLTSKLYDVTGGGSDRLAITGKAAAGKPFAVALVGRRAGGKTETVSARPGSDGAARAELPAGPYERVTAVVVNASATATWDAQKEAWKYDNDGLQVTTNVATVKPPTPTPTPTQTPTQTPAPPLATPRPPITLAPLPPFAVVIQAKSPTRASLRKGLPVAVFTTRPARVKLTLSASRSVAWRLRLGRKSIVLAETTATVNGQGAVVLRLSKKAAKAMRRAKAAGAKLTLSAIGTALGEARPAVATQQVKVRK